ncbi:MAG: phosphoribosylanthranilate isomerase [Pelagibacteraceae bacterium]
MLVKICGLNPLRDVQLCLDLNVNFLGFVFYKKSSRNLNLSDLNILNSYNKRNSFYVAVTVNPSDEFIDKIKTKNIDYIQLHGSEDNNRIMEIKKKSNLKIIKAIKVKSKEDIDNYKQFKSAEIILFDTPGMEQSIKFPKNLIGEIPKGNRYAIAGSVSSDTVENIAKLGVNFCDLSSNLESQLGYKDHLKIKKFMKKINTINNENTSI